jgi:hypothetical protein
MKGNFPRDMWSTSKLGPQRQHKKDENSMEENINCLFAERVISARDMQNAYFVEQNFLKNGRSKVQYLKYK